MDFFLPTYCAPSVFSFSDYSLFILSFKLIGSFFFPSLNFFSLYCFGTQALCFSFDAYELQKV